MYRIIASKFYASMLVRKYHDPRTYNSGQAFLRILEIVHATVEVPMMMARCDEKRKS